MKSTGWPRPSLPWRWLVDSPLLLAACGCVLVTAAVLLRVTGSLREASALNRIVAGELAAVVAESVVLAQARAPLDGIAAREVIGAGGVRCGLRPSSDGTGLLVTAEVAGGYRQDFRCELLPGMTPRVLGLPLVQCSGGAATSLPGAVQLAPADLPAVEATPEDDLSQGIRRDDGVALLRLPAGTDREDFLLDSDVALRTRGVVVVPGNLWIDEGESPLALVTDVDTTFLVRGNLYVLRSLRVLGTGCVTFVVQAAGGTPFQDRDGNGRWSANDRLLAGAEGGFRGPAEGAGAAYLGLAGRKGELALAAGLVITGELHVGADRALVHGPVVLRHGSTVLPGSAGELQATGLRLPLVERQLLPGFRPEGPPRPGLLRPLRAPGLPLYEALPAR